MDDAPTRKPVLQIGGFFVLVNAGLGSIGLLASLLRGQFLGSIFVLVAATVTLLCGPLLAGICGFCVGTREAARLVGVLVALGYVGGSLVSLGLLSLVGDLPLAQLGGSLLLFAVPTGLVGAGVSYLVK
ncbi:hypothetical protein [Haladaptatus sp. DYSN1]|uniref:hypothetical protein n=1 Tax=unclassified Haladaptatus TaxID=2622732 RepID=UPI0024057F4B|nr:hypothetical protein [Haladaptatus sp. DYSN1]